MNHLKKIAKLSQISFSGIVIWTALHGSANHRKIRSIFEIFEEKMIQRLWEKIGIILFKSNEIFVGKVFGSYRKIRSFPRNFFDKKL